MGRFRAFRAVNNVERYLFSLGEGFISLALDFAEMHEHIAPIFLFNESEPLRFIEPLYFASGCHRIPPCRGKPRSQKSREAGETSRLDHSARLLPNFIFIFSLPEPDVKGGALRAASDSPSEVLTR